MLDDLSIPAPAENPLKGSLLPLVALSVVAVGLWLPRMAGPLDLRWDGAVYYVLGTSIAEGTGYRLLNEPGDIEACQYPPLLPLIAAVPQMILGTSDPVVVGQWLKVIFFFFHGVLAVATYFMLGLFVPRWLAFWGALALLLNVQVVFHSNLFFSEIPFGAATVLFVLCNRRSGSWMTEALASAIGVAAFLLRTSGIALLAAWVVESLARRDFRRAAARSLISAIPVLCWNAHVSRVEDSPSYATPAYPYQRAPYLNHNVSYATNLSLVDDMRPELGKATAVQLAWRFLGNVPRIGLGLGEAVSESREYWKYQFHRVLPLRGQRFPRLKMISDLLFYVPLVLLSGLILWGMVVLLARGEVLVPAYVAATAILCCATPWPGQFRRYLTPLAPFLLAGLFAGLLSVVGWLRSRQRDLCRKGAPIALVTVLALILWSEGTSLRWMYDDHLHSVRSRTTGGKPVDYRVFYYASADEAHDECLDWLKTRAGPEDVVSTSMPQWAYMRNGLQAVSPPAESTAERAQALLDSVPVAYVVVSPKIDGSVSNDSVLRFVEGNPRAWRVVYADQKGLSRVFQRVRSDNRDAQ